MIFLSALLSWLSHTHKKSPWIQKILLLLCNITFKAEYEGKLFFKLPKPI